MQHYIIKCQNHVEAGIQNVWEASYLCDRKHDDLLAKTHATKNTQRKLDGRPLGGRWERKPWGWVRWDGSLCLSVFRSKRKPNWRDSQGAINMLQSDTFVCICEQVKGMRPCTICGRN